MQADQRRGRTGRTCDGHVYRLVKRSFYTQLEDYEPPAILRLSLRQQILLLCCAESKAINDPKGIQLLCFLAGYSASQFLLCLFSFSFSFYMITFMKLLAASLELNCENFLLFDEENEESMLRDGRDV